MSDSQEITCPACGSGRYVSVSFDRGWTRKAQCVPCGRVHAKLGGGDADRARARAEDRDGGESNG